MTYTTLATYAALSTFLLLAVAYALCTDWRHTSAGRSSMCLTVAIVLLACVGVLRRWGLADLADSTAGAAWTVAITAGAWRGLVIWREYRTASTRVHASSIYYPHRKPGR